MIKTALSFADVYRICKECWRSTKHEVFTDEAKGTKTFVCVECGFKFKEENHD